MLFDFPLLTDGGIERLAHYVESRRFRLIVVDVLAKVEPAARGGSDKTYHDIYGMFTPLQELHRRFPPCLALLTHLRKAEADDLFDTLHGSVAYQGARDVLWVLERRPQDEAGVLHLRDKDAEDRALHVAFVVGHWEYMGDAEKLKVSRERGAIYEVLREENRPLSAAEVGRLLSGRQKGYEACHPSSALSSTMPAWLALGEKGRHENGMSPLSGPDVSVRY